MILCAWQYWLMLYWIGSVYIQDSKQQAFIKVANNITELKTLNQIHYSHQNVTKPSNEKKLKKRK